MTVENHSLLVWNLPITEVSFHFQSIYRSAFNSLILYNSTQVSFSSDSSLHDPLHSPHPLPQILAPADPSQRPSSASERSSVEPPVLFLSFLLPLQHPLFRLCSDFNLNLVVPSHSSPHSHHSPNITQSTRSFHLLSSLPGPNFAYSDQLHSQLKNSLLPTYFPSGNDELRYRRDWRGYWKKLGGTERKLIGYC